MAGGGGVVVKQELVVADSPPPPIFDHSIAGLSVITISSTESSGDDNGCVVGSGDSFPGKRGAMLLDSCSSKKPKVEQDVPKFVLPVGFLDPLPPDDSPVTTALAPLNGDRALSIQRNKDAGSKSCKQFWKAGDYEGGYGADYESVSGGMDRLRVHPKFLHSNATSHKWALGAFAELLDNSMDEVCNGATYVKIDMLLNPKDGESKMLLVQDNGGGMTPEKMRQCMSLGYSAKSKIANTIGQYGNGFKTSTMRLGADVIVFSSCQGKDGSRPTKSVGILSYTFLRSTGKEDIIVPMIDFEKRDREWTKIIRTSVDDWFTNLDIIKQWSPYSSEEELLQQFQALDEQGTRIVIYNLWEDDMGQLELDFDADVQDIQIRGVNRDENKILLARQFPHSQHFLLFQHSLRNYASILYKRIPPGFRIILRREDVVHHNLVNDMVHSMEQTYKPQLIGDIPFGGEDMVAVVTVGFVKDAEAHMDIQGFNVYHKNRLIKPFWRVWNAAGSDGRGVIGVLEANFVEPAHDKQGFERTIALSRLESKLVQIQKNYWRGNCHKIGYAPRRKNVGPLPKLSSQEPRGNGHSSTKTTTAARTADGNGHASTNGTPRVRAKPVSYAEEVSSSRDHSLEDEMRDDDHESPFESNLHVKKEMVSSAEPESILKLKNENAELERRLLEVGGSNVADLQRDLILERNRCRSLEVQLEQAKEKMKEMNKEQETLVQVFSDERDRRAAEEENLRNRLQMASTTIQELLDKVKLLEKMRFSTCKMEK